MKRIFTLLSLLAIVGVAKAQFAQGPTIIPALTNAQATSGATGTVALVLMKMTTNLSAFGKSRSVQLNGSGFSFAANVGITNSTATTNCVFRFEFSVDGTNFSSSFRPTFTMTPNNTEMTNFPIDLVRNYRFVRLASIQNTNDLDGSSLTNNIFITNAVFGVR